MLQLCHFFTTLVLFLQCVCRLLFIIGYIYSINTYSGTRLQQLALFPGHFYFPLLLLID